MKPNYLYVVTMYRWGDRESHSYVLGCYGKKTQATKEADAEIAFRGGKYAPEILEVELNAKRGGVHREPWHAIVSLRLHPEMHPKMEAIAYRDDNPVAWVKSQ